MLHTNIRPIPSVGLPAVGPDLSTTASKRTNVAHVHHCARKIAVELGDVGRVGGGLGVRGASIVQLLVRVQETLLVDQVPVVKIVEEVWRHCIQRAQVVVAA